VFIVCIAIFIYWNFHYNTVRIERLESAFEKPEEIKKLDLGCGYYNELLFTQDRR